MIDKEYLKQLKEEDYIAWDELVNDPMVVGSSSGTGCLPSFVLFFILIIVILLGTTSKC